MTLYVPAPPEQPNAASDGATLHAVSPVAAELRRTFEDMRRPAHTTGTQRHADLTVALIEACSAADGENWDGYRGRQVAPGAYISAGELLRVFPEHLALPEISVHPDGELALDWIADRRNMFTVSIGADGALSYAGMFGKNKVTGREIFTGTFPAILLPHIKRFSAVDDDRQQA